jgi:hypothetical protein
MHPLIQYEIARHLIGDRVRRSHSRHPVIRRQGRARRLAFA